MSSYGSGSRSGRKRSHHAPQTFSLGGPSPNLSSSSDGRHREQYSPAQPQQHLGTGSIDSAGHFAETLNNSQSRIPSSGFQTHNNPPYHGQIGPSIEQDVYSPFNVSSNTSTTTGTGGISGQIWSSSYNQVTTPSYAVSNIEAASPTFPPQMDGLEIYNPIPERQMESPLIGLSGSGIPISPPLVLYLLKLMYF